MIRRFNLALALAVVAGGAFAQSAGQGRPGYVTSYSGNVVMSGQGECVRSGQWKPADAFEPCDPVPHAAVVPAPVVVAAPEPVAPAAPVEAPAPVTRVVIEKLTVTADVFFAFNKAELTESGKRALDELVSRTKDAEVDGIEIAGYADRIASAAYNQKLSEQRALAVKRYLEVAGANTQRVLAEGKGETSSITGDECRHMGPERASNRKLVDCLQPDRRVEIEVLGSRELVVQEAPAAAAGASAQ